MSRSPLLPLQKPIDETRESVAESCRRIVAEQLSRLRNVRASERHIAWLLRQAIDFCFSPKRLLYQRNQILKLNGLALPKIKDIEERLVIAQRRKRPLNNIVNVRVIAS